MINVGVIGVGNMGRHHARIYAEMAETRLCAVADADESRAAAVAARFGATAYRDYREMLRRERLDAVSVVAPTRDHCRIAADVISAGVSLLVEKPLAATPAAAERLVSAADRARVKLAVGHVERFNPAVQALKQQIDHGILGTLSSVVARRVGLMPPQIKDANVVVDLAVHDIDILNFMFGQLPEYVAASAGWAVLSDRYDHAEIFMKYGTAGCFVQVNWITPLKIRTLSVTGDAGHAELNYVTQKLEVYKTNAEREFDDFGDFVFRFGEAEKVTAPVERREPLRVELEDFVEAIIQDRGPAVSGEDGLNALRVAARVLEALH